MPPKRRPYAGKKNYDILINRIRILRLRIKFMLTYDYEKWAGLGAWHYGSGLLW